MNPTPTPNCEITLIIPNEIPDDYWLNEPRFAWFRKGYRYATTQTKAIPAMAQCHPADLYFAVRAIMRGAGISVPDEQPPQEPQLNPAYVLISFRQGESVGQMALSFGKTTDEIEGLLREAINARLEPRTRIAPNPACACAACNPRAWWMVLCPTCGNKRCPHAENHQNACTGSNAPDQVPTLDPAARASRDDHRPMNAHG